MENVANNQAGANRQDKQTFDFETESVALLGNPAQPAAVKKPVVRRGSRTIKWNSAHLPISAWGGNNPLLPGDGALM